LSKMHIASRMGVKFTTVSAVALAVAFCVYLILYEIVLPYFLSDERFYEYWAGQEQKAIADFQNYVTKKNLSRQAAIQDVEWEKEYRTMYIYLEEITDEYMEYLDLSEISGHELLCSDGTLLAYAYSSYTYYEGVGRVVALGFSVLCFFLILLPYFYHILHRIMRLSKEMEILSGGDLSYRICSPGRDELAQLGRDIEEMRLSVLEQMERETEAVSANNLLITSLSHDLRTPLTKLMGYLELLQYKKDQSDEERRMYLQKTIEKAGQIRDMTDEMFQHFEVRPAENQELAPVSGAVFLGQLISEQCWDLQAEGFNIQPPVMDGSYLLQVRVEDIKRVFDNVFSNLKKYADPHSPIRISTGQTEEEIWISLENHIRKSLGTESRGIGVPTMQMLMAQNNGRLEARQEAEVYYSTLWFQKLM
jgi:signal transduction histidine kinase